MDCHGPGASQGHGHSLLRATTEASIGSSWYSLLSEASRQNQRSSSCSNSKLITINPKQIPSEFSFSMTDSGSFNPCLAQSLSGRPRPISINAASHPTVRTEAFAWKISSRLIITAPGGLGGSRYRPPTPDCHLRRAGRKALEGACRVHLRVQRRTPCKEAGGSHRTPGSALRSDPPNPPVGEDVKDGQTQ